MEKGIHTSLKEFQDMLSFQSNQWWVKVFQCFNSRGDFYRHENQTSCAKTGEN